MDYPKSVPDVGLVGGRFVDENPATGEVGSLIPSAWSNAVTLEILNVIQAAGQNPDEADLTQLLKAVRKIGQISAGNYAADIGSANIYVANYSPVVTELVDGIVLRFKAAVTNTGVSSFNPNNLGAKPIVGGAYSPLGGGEIISNGEVWLQYNASLGGGSWVLLESTGGALQVAPASQSQHALQRGQLSSPIGVTAPQFDNTLRLATTAFVQSTGLQFSALSVFSVSGILTAAAHAGGLILGASNSPISLTLPSASTMPPRSIIKFWNYGPSPMTLIRAGSDAFVMPGIVSSLALYAGDSVTLTSNGAALWYAIEGSAQTPYSNGYLSSLGTTGWKRYPDSSSPTGYILEQWGTSGYIAAGASGSVTFPLVFSNAILTCSVSPIAVSNSNSPAGGVGASRTLSGLTLYNWNSTIAFSVTYSVKGY
jgi:hypothetical protein